MNRTLKTITVEIPVEFWAKEGVELPPLDNLEKYIRGCITNYDDGRYPFSVEMFERGFTEIVKYGVVCAADKFCESKYGNERICEGQSSYMRSFLESEKIWQKISVAIGDEDKIKIQVKDVV